jgi:hypothetical protein
MCRDHGRAFGPVIGKGDKMRDFVAWIGILAPNTDTISAEHRHRNLHLQAVEYDDGGTIRACDDGTDYNSAFRNSLVRK